MYYAERLNILSYQTLIVAPIQIGTSDGFADLVVGVGFTAVCCRSQNAMKVETRKRSLRVGSSRK